MADCFNLPNATELLDKMRGYADIADDNIYGICVNTPNVLRQAADVIEQLMQENAKLKAKAIQWYKITTRPLDEEEKEWFAENGYEPWEMPEFVYDCEMPEDGQEILIATPWGTDMDTCSNCAEYGIGLECHDDFDNVYAWAELPKYEEEENATD